MAETKPQATAAAAAPAPKHGAEDEVSLSGTNFKVKYVFTVVDDNGEPVRDADNQLQYDKNTQTREYPREIFNAVGVLRDQTEDIPAADSANVEIEAGLTNLAEMEKCMEYATLLVKHPYAYPKEALEKFEALKFKPTAWESKFAEDIEPEAYPGLLRAANQLELQPMINLICYQMAGKLKIYVKEAAGVEGGAAVKIRAVFGPKVIIGAPPAKRVTKQKPPVPESDDKDANMSDSDNSDESEASDSASKKRPAPPLDKLPVKKIKGKAVAKRGSAKSPA